ncbi:hypothetical protein Pla163_00220 [Planctomycetes bacterium Pla163]|uniref:Uncharacterized protein n=1 Tax=Rohdeia mirabilis TaxID=2528008 RepID=A0A518CUN9_9BACT|nr:hypothetical protein Pla163_00220 [Planctomycetes bacterium Pla163]
MTCVGELEDRLPGGCRVAGPGSGSPAKRDSASPEGALHQRMRLETLGASPLRPSSTRWLDRPADRNGLALLPRMDSSDLVSTQVRAVQDEEWRGPPPHYATLCRRSRLGSHRKDEPHARRHGRGFGLRAAPAIELCRFTCRSEAVAVALTGCVAVTRTVRAFLIVGARGASGPMTGLAGLVVARSPVRVRVGNVRDPGTRCLETRIDFPALHERSGVRTMGLHEAAAHASGRCRQDHQRHQQPSCQAS